MKRPEAITFNDKKGELIRDKLGRVVRIAFPSQYHMHKIGRRGFMLDSKLRSRQWQTAGSKRMNKYIMPTDPPTDAGLVKHMHSHARKMLAIGLQLMKGQGDDN